MIACMKRGLNSQTAWLYRHSHQIQAKPLTSLGLSEVEKEDTQGCNVKKVSPLSFSPGRDPDKPGKFRSSKINFGFTLASVSCFKTSKASLPFSIIFMDKPWLHFLNGVFHNECKISIVFYIKNIGTAHFYKILNDT